MFYGIDLDNLDWVIDVNRLSTNNLSAEVDKCKKQINNDSTFSCHLYRRLFHDKISMGSKVLTTLE